MSLAIPDPAPVDLDRARDLAAAVVAWAEECDDLTALEDARAKVAAIETYLRRRGEAVAAEIAAADRRLEVRIGSLLGPTTPGARNDLQPSGATEGSLSRHQRSDFRLGMKALAPIMADNPTLTVGDAVRATLGKAA